VGGEEGDEAPFKTLWRDGRSTARKVAVHLSAPERHSMLVGEKKIKKSSCELRQVCCNGSLCWQKASVSVGIITPHGKGGEEGVCCPVISWGGLWLFPPPAPFIQHNFFRKILGRGNGERLLPDVDLDLGREGRQTAEADAMSKRSLKGQKRNRQKKRELKEGRERANSEVSPAHRTAKWDGGSQPWQNQRKGGMMTWRG